MDRPWWKEDVRHGRAISIAGLIGFVMVLAASLVASSSGSSLLTAFGLVLLVGSVAVFLREVFRLRQSSLR